MTDQVDLCICCHKNPVTWPRVCDDCQDKEFQAYLAIIYGETVNGFKCRTCGMIYDGGQFCTYCGDRNPMNDPEEEDIYGYS